MVLIIYLSSWTFLYLNFLISGSFLHSPSFQFWSGGGKNTLSSLATTIYFLGAYVWSFHVISICLLFLVLTFFLGADIISFLVFSTTAIKLYIQDLLFLSTFYSLKSDISIYCSLLGLFFLWRNVFLDRSHISQRGANVITQKWSSRLLAPFSTFWLI